MGFVGDVGDLAKLAMAADNVRSDVGTAEETHDALAHELADCLWAVLVLAKRYEVDLEAAYVETMTTLEQRLAPGLTVGSVSPGDTEPTASGRRTA